MASILKLASAPAGTDWLFGCSVISGGSTEGKERFSK